MHIDPWILSFSAVTVLVTVWMGFRSAKTSKTASDFFVAGRSVGVGMNASAISGEYLSAASFMGVAGMVMSSGYDALWYPVCYACGYLFLLLFIAGPLRRFGAYTIPDFAEGRFDSPLFRKIAVVFVLFIGFFYTMPQMKGAGTTLAYIFQDLDFRGTALAFLAPHDKGVALKGLHYGVGVFLVGAVITLNVALGGMKGITLVQAFQYWAKMFAISVPIFVLMAVYGHYGRHLEITDTISTRDWFAPMKPEERTNRSSFTIVDGARMRLESQRSFLPAKAPHDETWLNPFGPLTTKAAKAAAAALTNRPSPPKAALPGPKTASFDVNASDSSLPAIVSSDLGRVPNDLVHVPNGLVQRENGLGHVPNQLVQRLSGLGRVPFGATAVPNELGRVPNGPAAVPNDSGQVPSRLGQVRNGSAEVLNRLEPLPNGAAPLPDGKKPLLIAQAPLPNGAEPLLTAAAPATSDRIPSPAGAAPVPDLGKSTTYDSSAVSSDPTAVQKAWLAKHEKPLALLYTYSLIIALVCGTAGLPHILVRFYTNPDGVAAKRTTMWVMILIGVFYLFPPVFGVMGRNLMPSLYEGAGAKGTDKVVLELPRILNQEEGVPRRGEGGEGKQMSSASASPSPPSLPSRDTPSRKPGFPWGSVLSGITCAGAFAAFMSTFSGLLVSMTGALAHDVYGRIFRPKSTPEQRLRMFKLCTVIVGGGAMLLGFLVESFEINKMVGWAFAIAATSYFPLLFLSTWWRGITMRGAATGMLVGGTTSLVAIASTMFADEAKWAAGLKAWYAVNPLWRILAEQPAIWALPLALGLMYFISKLTAKEVPADIRMKMLVLHAPEKLGLKQEYIQEHQSGH